MKRTLASMFFRLDAIAVIMPYVGYDLDERSTMPTTPPVPPVPPSPQQNDGQGDSSGTSES